MEKMILSYYNGENQRQRINVRSGSSHHRNLKWVFKSLTSAILIAIARYKPDRASTFGKGLLQQ